MTAIDGIAVVVSGFLLGTMFAAFLRLISPRG